MDMKKSTAQLSGLEIGETFGQINACSRPSQVRALRRWRIKAISTGPTHSAVIDEHDQVVTFGSNENGQLGVWRC